MFRIFRPAPIWILTIILGGFALRGATTAAIQSQPAAPTRESFAPGNYGDGPAQFLFFAVLEGCYRDGVQTDVAEVMTRRDKATDTLENFVYACPICMPVFDALTLYKNRQPFIGHKVFSDTFGSGLAEDLHKKLTGTDVSARQSSWTVLLTKWIHQRMEQLKMSDDERKMLKEQLSYGMKVGTTLLEGYKKNPMMTPYAEMKSCPSCNVAK